MALDPRTRFNLDGAAVLLLDDTPLGMSILVQIVTGLGAKQIYRCGSVEEAEVVTKGHQLDLAIVDSLSHGGGGYDFVKWLRREAGEPNCFTPVIVTTGHTPERDVGKARDCGGHIMVKKPIAPLVMLERIIWVSKEGRPFLFAEDYVGPDRRFRAGEAPAEVGERRKEKAAADTPAEPSTTRRKA